MEFMSAREAADKWGISQRRVAVLCSESRIDNAIMVGNMWIIPTTAKKPIDARSIRYVQSNGKKVKPFLKWAGGKGQLLSEIEKYYPFADGKITKDELPALEKIIGQLEKMAEVISEMKIAGEKYLNGK